MTQLHIQTLDLNLLRLFDVLLEERSVTRAGARLGLSQSAVSHALSRLRHSLGDELFLRGASGMSPTPKARELGPPIRAALTQLQAAITPQAFDPTTTDRRFVLVAGAYACAILIPALAARLAEAAPGADLVVVPAAADLLEQLDSRRADFVLGGAATAPERLAQDTLLHETLTWVVRAENPLPAGAVTLEDLVSTPHVVIGRDRFGFGELGAGPGTLTLRSSWDDFGALEVELSERGLKRRIGVTVPDSYSALAVVRRSDMAALIPRRLALLSTQTGLLRLIEPPYRSPRVDLSLLYLRERLAEPAIAWMRDQLKDIAAEM
jgi:DNA-binding transcriptional LysR family regulator